MEGSRERDPGSPKGRCEDREGEDTVIISEESGCRERNNCVSQPRCMKKSEIGTWKKA